MYMAYSRDGALRFDVYTGVCNLYKRVHSMSNDPAPITGLKKDPILPGQTMVASYDEPAVLFDPQDSRIYANRHAASLSHYFEGDINSELLRLIDITKKAKGVFNTTITLPAPSGQSVYQLTLVPDVLGKCILFLFHDQSTEHSLRDALVESRQRYKDMVNVFSDFSWEVDGDGKFQFVSRTNALGYESDEMIGHSPTEFIVGADEYKTVPFVSEKVIEEEEIWMNRADGGMACVLLSSIPFYNEDGSLAGVRGVCRDVTGEREREIALAQVHHRERMLGHIVNTIREEADLTDMLASAAAASARALGAGGCRVLRLSGNKGNKDFINAGQFGEDGPGELGEELTGFKPGERWLREDLVDGWNVLVAPCVRNKKLNGMLCLWRREEWSDDSRLLVADISGQLGITIEQIINHENILHLSRTDSMTGLLNRRAFYEEELPRRFKRLAFDGNSGALFFVDMDNFKMVNDVHGHQAGDDAIIALRDLIYDFVRPGDLVCRLGGDEFALWLDGVDEEIASSRCAHLLKKSESLRKFSGDSDHPLGISVGIAIYSPVSNENLDSLLARADAAMYEVKQKSKGDFRLAEPYKQ